MPRPPRRRRLWTVTVLVMLTAGTVAAQVPTATAGHVHRNAIQWACGFGGGTPGACGIQPIDDPEYTTRSWIGADDKVIGVDINGDVRAFPTKMLDNHEIVNDVIGGTPVAVTWCPLCGSAIVFQRVVDFADQPRVLVFDVSGYLYKNDLVMYDRETNTLWTQISGTAIASWDGTAVRTTHTNATLDMLPSELTTWRDWRDRHPGTSLLSNEGRGYGGAYPGYGENCAIGVSGGSDCNITGLHPKEQMIGVALDSGSAAYPYFGVRQVGGIVVDSGPGRDIVVAANRDGAAWVYDATGHRFVKEGDDWVDETGQVWDLMTGMRADGRDRLPRLDHVQLFWFAWQGHYPDTELWLPPTLDGQLPTKDTGFLPGPSFVLLIAVAALAAVTLAGARRRFFG